MRTYGLSAHARVCVTEHGAIFLDLQRSAYVGIDPAQARALAAVVEGWPAFEDESTAGEDHEHAFAGSLVAKGLLVASQGKQRQPVPANNLPEVQHELIPWDEMSSRHINAGHVLAFIRAVLTAVYLTRFRSFAAITRRVGRHRQEAGDTFDRERAEGLVTAYHYIRTWTFARAGRCLLDSVALVEFLRIHGVHASWVVGVQLRPFSAHSWVQHEHWVLNGTPAFVREYMPIIVV